jgi:hypothetical protein
MQIFTMYLIPCTAHRIDLCPQVEAVAVDDPAAATAPSPSPTPAAAPVEAGHVEVGEERAAAEQAAAAGELKYVSLYAPGRLLYIRPDDVALPEDQQTFSLLEGKSGNPGD